MSRKKYVMPEDLGLKAAYSEKLERVYERVCRLEEHLRSKEQKKLE